MGFSEEVHRDISSISVTASSTSENNTQPSLCVVSQQLRPNTQRMQVTPGDNGGPDWKQLGGNGQTAGYMDKKSLNI